ncbi:MAG TPA: hypothetical protein VKT81_25695 [Bryobacteraceae bacterium]|nr:hypothetical protein [Bryobacteraceae bacterium]
MKQIFPIAAALIAGFAGGMVGGRVAVTSKNPGAEKTVRARAFELIDQRGKTISFWGIDKAGNVVLAFGSYWPTDGERHPTSGLDDPHNQRAAFGVIDDFPYMSFRALDGKQRMHLSLSSDAKPSLWMADDNEPRLSLGVVQSDTPSAADNNWALVFKPDRGRIGMFNVNEGGQVYIRGFLAVNQDKLKYPYER